MKRNCVSYLLGAGLCAALYSGVANAVPTDIDYSSFTGVWLFDDAGNRLKDYSGKGNNLTIGAGAPTYSAPAASGNGWVTKGLGASSFNAAGGQRVDTPAGIYTGGSFTWVYAARQTSANLSFGTQLSSNRFQMYQGTNPGQESIRGTGGAASFNGTGNNNITPNDWHVIALRYNSGTNTVEIFDTTNSTTLDTLPDSYSSTFPGMAATVFGLGGDGLSGAGGFDGYTGQLDFALFQNGFLTNQQLTDILNFFQDGPTPPLAPEPSTIVLFGAAIGMVGAVAYTRRRNRAA